MKRLCLFLPLLLVSVVSHPFVEKFIRDDLNKADVSAINQNFKRISEEFDNTVHRTSTETIHGIKYFSDPVSLSGTLGVAGQTSTTGGLQLQVSTAPRTSTTLGGTNAPGRLVYNTTDNYLCVSTSTNQNSYVIVSTISKNVPCEH